MGNPYITFNGKTVRSSSNLRLLSPYPLPEIPEDTLRFEFLDSHKSFNPNTDLDDDYAWAAGTWTNVYGSIWDWTYHNPKWYLVGYSSAHAGPYLYTVLSVTSSSNPGAWYNDGTGNPLYDKKFRIIGGNTSNITHMPKLFYRLGRNCTEVGRFDTHNVVNAAEMFRWGGNYGMHATTLPAFDFSSITNDELTDEGLSNNDRTNLVGLYQWCYTNTFITEVPSITFPSNRAINTKNMFYGCTSLVSANIVGLNSSNAEGMFSRKTSISAPSFTNCTLNNPKTLFGVTTGSTLYPVTVTMNNVALTGDATSMFRGCTALTAVPSFDASGLTSLQYAFRDCSHITSVPQMVTSNVTDFGGTFYGCSTLTAVPLLDTSSATTIASMFSNCTSLQTVPLFNTANVTKMSSTFYRCLALTTVPLFNTANVTDMYRAFFGCSNVESGALALYQQASSQTTPPSNHDGTFTNCGVNTTTGAAELAQIPTSWGGTMA